MSSSSQKLSFTVRRPTPPDRGISPATPNDNAPNFKVPALPRHLSDPSNASSRRGTSSPRHEERHEYDSSDEEDQELQDELVTGFDKFGVQRADGRKNKTKAEPLMIPALKNKDWRAVARKRRGGHYVPESGKVGTGADGSVGGLGTRDTINSGPTLSGLQVMKREKTEVDSSNDDVAMEEVVDTKEEMEVEETEDQRALRALLAEANGVEHEGPTIHAIPTPVSEADTLKQDIEELPEAATLEDYERVPVSQFGAAMLRGMGWKEGTAATRKPGKGLVEPYLPTSRPALLGIGAKEQEVFDDGSKRKPKKLVEKYIPIVKKERSDSNRDRERSRSPRRSAPTSRRSSRSPSRRDRESSHRGDSRSDYSRRREREYDDQYERSKDKTRDRERDQERDRDYHRDYDRDKSRRGDSDRDRHRDRGYRKSEASRDGSRRRDY